MPGATQSAPVRVLFYTHSPRAFRTTLIGHLYEICQAYHTVLLAEKLDPETESAIRDRALFPRLDEVVPIRQFSGPRMNLFARNRYLFNLAREVVKRYPPDVVITGSDMDSLFELYLLRFARRTKALRVAIQSTIGVVSAQRSALLVDLTNAYTRFPRSLPLALRLVLVRWRKRLGHVLFYWLLPLMVGEVPLWGKSSHILRKGKSGMRDVDFQVVFSQNELETFQHDGVPVKRLRILSHPLCRKARYIFQRAFLDKVRSSKNGQDPILVILPESGVGFRRDDYSAITKEERETAWADIIGLVTKLFHDRKILVKPHPDIPDPGWIRTRFEKVSPNAEVLDPQEPVDRYVERAEFVLGLPLSASTALFTASMQCPEKAILSLDLHQELMGDLYRDFEGVEYVESREHLVGVLGALRDGKRFSRTGQDRRRPEGWSGTVELLQSVGLGKPGESTMR